MNEAIPGLISAIEQGRTDVVRSAINALEKFDHEAEENSSGFTLDNVLNSLLTPAGTLLHMASKNGQVDIARTLLASGADPGVHNKDAKTPLDIAADQKMKQVFNEQLLQAVAVSDIGSICQLIAAGVDVNLLDTVHSGNTPLHWAASYGSKDVVQCLVKRGGNINTMNTSGATPLHDAVARGDLNVIEEILLSGADPDIAGTQGKYKDLSAKAVAQDQEDVMKLFEKYKNHSLANGVVVHPVNGIHTAADMQSPASGSGNTQTSQNGPILLNTPNMNRATSVDTASLVSPTLSLSSSTTNISVVTDTRLHLLWPKPMKIIQRAGKSFKPADVLTVYVNDPLGQGVSSRIMDMWHQHEHYLHRLNLSLHMENYTTNLPRTQSQLVCQINDRLFTKSQSYRLMISNDNIRLDANDMSGLHYGITTFVQLLKLCHEDGIPPLQIHDQPCVRDRAVMLDLSKGRIPTEDSFRHIILTLSYLKINQLQMYMRFQVPKDPEIKWQFYYARSTLMALDRYAQSVCVTLVPVIDVLPSVTFDDLADVYASFDQFISCFTSTNLTAVGPRLSSFLMDLSEDGVLISDDTRRLLPVPSHHTVQICAYMFHEAPAALANFPQNTVLAEYGFQANYDFSSLCHKYEEFGVPFCVVPGTAAWNSLAGCPEATVSNLYNAVKSVVSLGGLGVTVSHWSGVGHLTHHPMSFPGIITAAGMAWNADVTLDFMHANLADLLNHHVLEDHAGLTGQIILELGRAETYILRCSRNQDAKDNSKLPAEKGSTLYQLISRPDDVSLEHLTQEVFQKSMRHIRKCQAELANSKLACYDGPAVLMELQLTADYMLTASKIGRALLFAGKNPLMTGFKVINPGIANLVATTRTDLANRLLSQLELYQSVWLRRNLPQNLHESLHVFTTLLNQLIPNGTPKD